ncbi:MAG: nucleotidyltransferase family protein [Phaeodactylibacter sp.]|nr:nucleotidyltransferase family protein [Phaeodactylibacter sp.]MCB9264493.1 nucleotidyltransferase family protein [Lewinellaceae bacterium]MCB9286164.1 nucleotidyltransferase family protein [Lewinellaceae bacterium]
MKAMIFAAGLGTRLRPLTENKPKALVEAGGMALLEITIRRLKYFGVREAVVNIHHFGKMILDFLERHQNFGIDISVSDERGLLLDTGGGLQKAAPHFKGASFLVHNVDVLSDIDLRALYQAHLTSGALATLAVRNRASSRHLLFDEAGFLAGWRHNRTGEERISRPAARYQPLAFSGLYVLSPRIFEFMPPGPVFSIIDVFLEAAKAERLLAYRHDDSLWLDVGKVAALEQAEALVKKIPLA